MRGSKTGGRQKGTPNKATVARQQEIAASGETPLDYMLRIMRDETAEPTRRDNMAAKAAPYVHPTFASVQHGGHDGGPVKVIIQGSDANL